MNDKAKWFVKTLLVASLVLNVAFAWLLWSPAVKPTGGALRTAAPMAALQRVAEGLPADDRAALRDSLLARAPAMRAAQQRYERQSARVLELVAAEPLDLGALEAEIQAARASRQVAADELVAAFLEALPRMSPETRRKLAERGNVARK
jgi:uncharacterized membrane protein